MNGTQKHVSLQGRNMPMDRLYSGIPLAKWLLSKKKLMWWEHM